MCDVTTNAERAERARPVIEQYIREHDLDAADLLTDIMHAITASKVNPNYEFDRAWRNYVAEVEEDN